MSKNWWETAPREEVVERKKKLREWMIKNNPTNNPETRKKISLARKGYKQTEEHTRRAAQAHIGTHRSEETKRKMAEAGRKRRHSEKSKKKMSLAKKGKHISPETEFKKGGTPQWMRDRATANLPRGENHWNWQGGIAKERDLIKILPEYKQWVKSVFKRDNYTCQRCLKRGGNLCAHHIIPFSVASKERFEISNGATLCEPCHYFIHSKELVVNQHV